MKKKFTGIAVCFCSILMFCSSYPWQTFTVQAATTNEKSDPVYGKLKKINQSLSQQLYDLKLQQKKDHEKWSQFIKSIHYLQNKQVEIYVTESFNNLSAKKKHTIVSEAQLFTIRIADKIKNFDQRTYMDGLAVVVFCNGNYIGRSKYLENKDFTWKQNN